MSDYHVMLGKYRAKEGGAAVPLQIQNIPPSEKFKVVQEYDASQPAPPVQPALQSTATSHALPTPNIETTNFPTPPQSQLHRPPGIPADPKSPWDFPLPTDSDDDSDDYVDATGLSYSDTEKERAAKLRSIKRQKEQPPPPPPFIDDKDTDARWLSYSDTEDDRARKINFQKKYPVRTKMKITKYKL